MEINCVICKKQFYVKPSHYERGTRCCSNACRIENKKTGEMINCTSCDKPSYKTAIDIAKNRSGLFYCSKSCKAKYENTLRTGENHPNYKNGFSSYRDKAIKHYGLSCSEGDNCLTKNSTLPDCLYEIDHIDSNRKNNKLNNLRVLCVACHRIKTMESRRVALKKYTELNNASVA